MATGFNEEKLRVAPLIRLQLQDARRRKAGHMLRIQNTTTEEIFVLLVQRGTGPIQAFSDYVEENGTNFDPIECYDMDVDLEAQVQAHRTVNWDKPLSVQTGPISAVAPWNGLGPTQPNQDPDDFVGRNRKK